MIFSQGRAGRGRGGGGLIQGRAVSEGVAEEEIYSNSGAGWRAAAEGRELFVSVLFSLRGQVRGRRRRGASYCFCI